MSAADDPDPRPSRPEAPSGRPDRRPSRPEAPSGRPGRRPSRPAAASGRPGRRPSRPAAASGRADSLRLFVALELPAAARAALVAFRDAAADPEIWRPIPEDALHLTLAFLGRRPATDVPAIERALRAAVDRVPRVPVDRVPRAPVDPVPRAAVDRAPRAAGPAPRLALTGALLLPPRRARVLCASLADLDGTLAELQAGVSDGLAAAGVYTPEKRPYRAHATVARLRPRARAPRAVDAQPEPLEFHGEALTLFESRLHPHGARYAPLMRLNLH